MHLKGTYKNEIAGYDELIAEIDGVLSDPKVEEPRKKDFRRLRDNSRGFRRLAELRVMEEEKSLAPQKQP